MTTLSGGPPVLDRPVPLTGVRRYLSIVWLGQPLWVHLLLAFGYVLAGRTASFFSGLEGVLAGNFFLQQGYALMLAAQFGIGALPATLVGHGIYAALEGVSPSSLVLSTLSNGLVVYACTVAFRRTRFSLPVRSPQGLVALVLVALVAYQLLSRTLGTLLLFRSSDQLQLSWGLYQAILADSLVHELTLQVLVCLTLLCTHDEWQRGRRSRYWLGGLASALAMSVVLVTLLQGWWPQIPPLQVFSMLYVATMLLTFAYGLHGAAFGNLTMLAVLQWAGNANLPVFEAVMRAFGRPDNVSTVVVGTIISTCLVGALLREKSERARHLFQLATRDVLTGLVNRRHFFESANREVARLHRQGGALALLYFDLDHFKRINDQHGHAAGDRVLRFMGDLLQRIARGSDIPARIGGEEFVWLAPDSHDAMAIARKLQQAIYEHLPDDLSVVPFTVSVGVTMVHPDETSIDAALTRADGALYQAKHAGRDQAVFVP
ncbi:diguanylate cyclase [Chitinimonas sp. BJYL2]|uniref:GGDEF domain-containing protein n=1 Tax=Chitinimonas sp. BJYL2 TaxID=2976696 RepID=UPI0022B340D6|nr:GGDEF domain-containing protein [Chitinimonas sp. BJYL2]